MHYRDFVNAECGRSMITLPLLILETGNGLSEQVAGRKELHACSWYLQSHSYRQGVLGGANLSISSSWSAPRTFSTSYCSLSLINNKNALLIVISNRLFKWESELVFTLCVCTHFYQVRGCLSVHLGRFNPSRLNFRWTTSVTINQSKTIPITPS